MSMKLKDRRTARNNYDPASVDSNSYNDAAGGRKVTNVGHHLKPIRTGAATWTTDASARIKIGKGVSIAVYGVADGTVNFGDALVATLAVGVTDADGSVGIPVLTGQWIYLNSYLFDHVITSSANIKVFLIEDDTYIINTP